MLYKDEKRTEKIAIKAKPSIVKLTKLVWDQIQPWMDEVDYNALFEQLITLTAANVNAIPAEDLPPGTTVLSPTPTIQPESELDYDFDPNIIPEPNDELADNIELVPRDQVEELLR